MYIYIYMYTGAEVGANIAILKMWRFIVYDLFFLFFFPFFRRRGWCEYRDSQDVAVHGSRVESAIRSV